MALACSSLGAVAVAGIYMIFEAYRDYARAQLRRDFVLRSRVAQLLWSVADQAV